MDANAKAMRVGWRRFTRPLRLYDPEKRPTQAKRVWIGIAGVFVLAGLLGYVVPAILTRLF